jgi:hypothetical protein
MADEKTHIVILKQCLREVDPGEEDSEGAGKPIRFLRGEVLKVQDANGKNGDVKRTFAALLVGNKKASFLTEKDAKAKAKQLDKDAAAKAEAEAEAAEAKAAAGAAGDK